MTLATATKKGRPSARAVLLKGFDALGFVFYTHYRSRKGRELERKPAGDAALLLDGAGAPGGASKGRVARVSAAESDEYFASRPLGSRLSATVSPQSEPVESRDALESAAGRSVQAFFATLRLARRIGAGTVSLRNDSNSGRAARTASTTGCATARREAPGKIERLAP